MTTNFAWMMHNDTFRKSDRKEYHAREAWCRYRRRRLLSTARGGAWKVSCQWKFVGYGSERLGTSWCWFSHNTVDMGLMQHNPRKLPEFDAWWLFWPNFLSNFILEVLPLNMIVFHAYIIDPTFFYIIIGQAGSIYGL